MDSTPKCPNHPVPGKSCHASRHDTARNGGVPHCMWCGRNLSQYSEAHERKG
jgi:hypothetical protein